MQWKSLPPWLAVSLILNGILGVWVYLDRSHPNPVSETPSLPSLAWTQWQPDQSLATESSIQTPGGLGKRHSLNYEGWVALLSKEASALAVNPPQALSILAGDSISLWFPGELLPPDQVWLNQGISGETTQGLLKRLDAFQQLNPDRIFVMIGINDLLRGISPNEVLREQKQLIQTLKKDHPESLIILQSILPHSAEAATWEGRDRLLKLDNQTIATLNQNLKQLAQAQDVYYLDLWPLFLDQEGKLRAYLTTDGLHLNENGYLVWSVALELFNQKELLSPPLVPPLNPNVANEIPFRFPLQNWLGSQARINN